LPELILDRKFPSQYIEAKYCKNVLIFSASLELNVDLRSVHRRNFAVSLREESHFKFKLKKQKGCLSNSRFGFIYLLAFFNEKEFSFERQNEEKKNPPIFAFCSEIFVVVVGKAVSFSHVSFPEHSVCTLIQLKKEIKGKKCDFSLRN